MKNGNLYQELKTAKKDYKIAHTRELAMEKKFKEVPSSRKYEANFNSGGNRRL